MPTYKPSVYSNRSSVSRVVSESLGVEAKLTGLASGLVSPDDYMPTTRSQYQQFRRFLHDIFCLSLMDIGLFQGHELLISDLGLNSDDKQIRMQKPDLYKVSGDSLFIGELTCTYVPEKSSLQKHQKYQKLVEFYQNSGFTVTFSVITVDLSDPEWDLKFPAITGLFLDIISDLLNCLRLIHSNPVFNSMRKEETGRYSIDRMAFKLEDQTVVDLVNEATGVKTNINQINSAMFSHQDISDQTYIDSIAMSIINDKVHSRPIPNPKSFEPIELVDDYKKFCDVKPNTFKKPKILQLGAPSIINYLPLNYNQFISKVRLTPSTGGYLTYIKAALEVTSLLDDHLITLNITSQQLEREQLSGPGKKNYLKRNGLQPSREAPTHIGISKTHIRDLEQMIQDVDSINIGSLREVDTQDSSESGLTSSILLMDIQDLFMRSPVSALLQFYQFLSREITLNSMRRRKTRQYALGYSMFEGVFFLIAPGPQLRTESNIEFVKLISTNPPFTNPYSAIWHSEGDHWESDWLSVDIDRLKQWQRSFDRVSLSCLANAERLTRPELSLKKSVESEISLGNYSLLALTFLEDKQLTSTTNQTIRYLWMKSLGDKQFKGLFSKFPTRINSIIQSFMIQRSVESCIKVCNTDITELVSVNRTIRDEETGNYDESTTGILNLMPRLFTFGDFCPIAYNLNEIYWCVSYNKDRQNQTQDAMNILNKILKEEHKFDEELSSRNKYDKVKYLFGDTTIDQDIKHIRAQKPESHFYSRRAITCGIKLQDKHKENQGDNGSWLTSEKLDKLLSKNLSEYATFKASVKTIQNKINPRDLNEVKKIGVRTKAIELVAEIVQNEHLTTALEVVMSYSGENNKLFDIFIQIFKKNQVGGVREIIILFIKARILFNIVEEIARMLSKSDKREILTKGRDKRLMMRGDYEEILNSFPKGTPVKIFKESYDMTTWAQKFIPTIFIPLFDHHFKDFRGMSDLARFVFLKHTNKKMEYPKKLIEQWIKHPEIKYEDEWMSKKKNKFLSDGEPWFYNHSNMCQGIPHYNSTVLALSCLSLRDALFDSCIKQLGLTCSINWKTRAGSDDKGTIIGLDLTKKDSFRQYLLLGQCERASERLHSMELSVKSASGHLMYELNSAFMANLETLSPTIKFSLAAVDMIGTTSCTSFINESYGRIRQLRENGSSSIICSFAHSLNSQHFYDIFDTRRGGENDLVKILNTPMNKIPYDFGVYPTYDIDIQDIIGPEFHNYRIVKSDPKSKLIKLLYTEITKDESDELFPNDESALLKKDHFGISQGLIRQLTNMRRRLNADPVKINDFFINNPFVIVRGPETVEETKNLILAKLFTKGASEALRRTSPAIYIGRLSAFRTSKSWTSPFQEMEAYNIERNEFESNLSYIKTTYKDFLINSLKTIDKKHDVDIETLLNVLFPQKNSLDIVQTFVGKFGATKTTDKRYSQAVRTWTVNNFNYEYTSSLKSIIETSFGQSHDSSIEDVNEFKNLIKMNLTSLEEFTEQCKQRGVRPLDMFFYMIKLHKASKTSRIQAFGHGPSTNGLHMSILSLKKYNHIPGTVMLMDHGIELEQLELENTMSRQLDHVKLFYNILIMCKNGFLDGYQRYKSFNISKTVTLEQECLTTIRSIRSISGFDQITQKTLKLVATELLDINELKEKLLTWKTLNYTYLKKQKRSIKNNGQIQWSGNLSVLVSSENECFTLNQINDKRFLETNRVNDVSSIYRSLKEMCKTLNLEFNSFFQRKSMKPGDIYLSTSTKMLHSSEMTGEHNNVLSIKYIPTFKFKRLNDLEGFKVMTEHNTKTGEIQIYLSTRDSRTSSICHSNGNYYPVEIPGSLQVSDNLSYLGVNLKQLFRNRSWFFNFRLPKMTQADCVNFLKTKVDLKIVLKLEDRDRQRINDYIEVREEVNEDSFAILNKTEIEIDGQYYEPENLTSETIAEMFRRTVEDEQLLPKEIYNEPIEDWADEVIENYQEEFDDLVKGNDDEKITMARSIGYKKPKARRAMHTISGLQQGGILKSRILDCYFNNQGIKNERIKQLPHMYLWIKQNTHNIGFELSDNLMEHILANISTSTGTSKNRVRDVLNTNSNQYVIPIQTLDNIISGRSTTNIDVLDQILEVESLEEVENDSELSDLD